MKTKTYLRLSLLIPFFVWVIALAIFLIWTALFPISRGLDGSGGIADIILLPLLFYVWGIIGWLLPYLLLALILFVWSFRSRDAVLMKVFALSPVVMTIIIVVIVDLLSLGDGGWSTLSPNPTTNALFVLGSHALFGLLTLLWGYVCVGLGYGFYKLLQYGGFIKDKGAVTATPLNESS